MKFLSKTLLTINADVVLYQGFGFATIPYFETEKSGPLGLGSASGGERVPKFQGVSIMHLKQLIKDSIATLIASCLTGKVCSFLCHEPYFGLWEKKGLHITPVHFYQPIPDKGSLTNYQWNRRSDMPGVEMNEGGQLGLLADFSGTYKAEYEAFPRSALPQSGHFYVNNGTFESVDCEVYYCMIRHFKPRRIIEVGGGNSTLLSARAALANKKESGAETILRVIEPFPGPALEAGFPGLTELLEAKAEQAPLKLFLELEENDILFIDSSHTLKIGGDVQRLYLEILPQLKKGVLIHIHDIFFPTDYPENVVMGRNRFWTEQYLVQAFLAFNSVFKVVWSSSYMHHSAPSALEEAFYSYSRPERRPASLWLTKTE